MTNPTQIKLVRYIFLILILTYFPICLNAQNNALDFDGMDEYIQTSLSINIGNDFTIEFWMKMGSYP